VGLASSVPLENLFSKPTGHDVSALSSLLHGPKVLEVIGDAITGKSGLLQRLANTPTLCATFIPPDPTPTDSVNAEEILGHIFNQNVTERAKL